MHGLDRLPSVYPIISLRVPVTIIFVLFSGGKNGIHIGKKALLSSGCIELLFVGSWNFALGHYTALSRRERCVVTYACSPVIFFP
jgi:hypothetical protein